MTQQERTNMIEIMHEMLDYMLGYTDYGFIYEQPKNKYDLIEVTANILPNGDDFTKQEYDNLSKTLNFYYNELPESYKPYGMDCFFGVSEEGTLQVKLSYETNDLQPYGVMASLDYQDSKGD